jgi:hypothetical protein
MDVLTGHRCWLPFYNYAQVPIMQSIFSLASGDGTLLVLGSTPLCRSGPPFDRSFHPFNPHSGPRPPQSRAATSKRLYRTRKESSPLFTPQRERASGKALALISTYNYA